VRRWRIYGIKDQNKGKTQCSLRRINGSLLDCVGKLNALPQTQTKTLDQMAASGCSQEDSDGKADEPALTAGEGENMMILAMTSLGHWKKVTIACSSRSFPGTTLSRCN
jgi:hypothetical protein